MRDEPTFAESIAPSVVGDDPLGLAPTNERLYNSAFPGFNNVVRHIRVYAAICWMTKQVSLGFERGDASTNRDAKHLFEAAISKLEIALLWANPGVRGMAGSQRQFPQNDEPIEFAFDSFGSSEVSLFAAVTYRPSLTNGLQFLEPRTADTFGCTVLGEALADAFDAVIRERESHVWLRAPDELTGSRALVEELAPALDVQTPSPGEQRAFLASFFPPEVGEDARNDDRARWLTLTLMLKSIDVLQGAQTSVGVTQDAIRACMARGMTPSGETVVCEELASVQAWWAVLQVRQLQRLCLEALYCVVERWIATREADGQNQSLATCIAELSVAGISYISHVGETVALWLEHFKRLQHGHPSLYVAAAHLSQEEEDYKDVDVFSHISRLSAKSKLDIDGNGKCEAVANAYAGLLFCATEAKNLSANPEALAAMKADVDSCSLLSLATLVDRSTASSAQDFLGHIIKEWVVLRHFEIAATRSFKNDGKNRFRFVIGDYGLERFDKTARLPLPTMSADKLEHALLLCEQGGLLYSDAVGYGLSGFGQLRLA